MSITTLSACGGVGNVAIATFPTPPQCDPRGAFFAYQDNFNESTKFPGKQKKTGRLFCLSFCKKISARRDSNPRPRPWQGRAPPTEPLAQCVCAVKHIWYFTIPKYICQHFFYFSIIFHEIIYNKM